MSKAAKVQRTKEEHDEHVRLKGLARPKTENDARFIRQTKCVVTCET